MEYYEVKEWLDAIVDIVRKQHQLETLTNFIKTHSVEDSYFLHAGINIISDIMKIPISCKETKDIGIRFPYRYSFQYRGIDFVQLEEKPLEGGYYGAGRKPHGSRQ